jgi:hypothetical protein
MKINKILCDNCKEELEDAECHPKQVKFCLDELMDGGMRYDFCSVECLTEFLTKHKFEERFHKFNGDANDKEN